MLTCKELFENYWVLITRIVFFCVLFAFSDAQVSADNGYSDQPRGLFDVNLDGKTDWCRIVATDPNYRASCDLGADGRDIYEYYSDIDLHVGYRDKVRGFWDVNGDWRRDWCRCEGTTPNHYMACILSGPTSFTSKQIDLHDVNCDMPYKSIHNTYYKMMRNYVERQDADEVYPIEIPLLEQYIIDFASNKLSIPGGEIDASKAHRVQVFFTGRECGTGPTRHGIGNFAPISVHFSSGRDPQKRIRLSVSDVTGHFDNVGFHIFPEITVSNGQFVVDISAQLENLVSHDLGISMSHLLRRRIHNLYHQTMPKPLITLSLPGGLPSINVNLVQKIGLQIDGCAGQPRSASINVKWK